jgi:hypothetical protein
VIEPDVAVVIDGAEPAVRGARAVDVDGKPGELLASDGKCPVEGALEIEMLARRRPGRRRRRQGRLPRRAGEKANQAGEQDEKAEEEP